MYEVYEANILNLVILHTSFTLKHKIYDKSNKKLNFENSNFAH